MSTEVENIIKELEGLDCRLLIDLQSVKCFAYPRESYFQTNLSNIEEKGILFPYSKENLYQIPENYFENQIENLSEITIASELEEEPFTFEKEKVFMPFAIPSGYFEQLRPDFLDKEEAIIEKKETAKIVSFFQNLNKYVAAAVILVVFSLGANIMLHLKQEKKAYQLLNNMNINNELADVPTEEILNYLNQSSSKNMEYLINPTGGENLINKAISNGKSDKNNLNGASNEEILEFLSDEDHGF
ncbi:MAG: hypothetical protein DI598_13715 [Pseudopedobacter saltans]|uniref:Uncharacterized protein n=1 Tax=Pseudopedobacter saltans TaxID=151895 RepID=A0A2W5EM48_9SPHI|nr:MAG: hypothetical protein DI598_13715 [Pseudopedobacter saltans]